LASAPLYMNAVPAIMAKPMVAVAILILFITCSPLSAEDVTGQGGDCCHFVLTCT
jgi:hypothetical protein